MDAYYNNCKFYNEYNGLLDDFSKSVEEGSRFLINKYIEPDMKVLELGARYGTVSVCLDYLLNNPSKQLLCVDPDMTVKDCLQINKDMNGCTFNIYNGTISKKELYVCYNGCCWESKTYVNPPANLKSIKTNTLSLDKIQELYDINFDCVLADCEGFLLEFINENPEFFDNIKCLIYEEDCGKKNPINNDYIDYGEVENFLISKNFYLAEVYTDKIGLDNKVWLKNKDNFHIFIASCYEGLDIQVPRLIKNIIKSNIPVNFVHFIVGGCPEEKTYYIDGIEIVTVKYRCFEFTPHIYLVNNPDKYDFDYAFYTHDTVEFGINFYNTVKNDVCFLREQKKYDTIKIECKNIYSSNIGIYSKRIILLNKEILLSISLNSNEYNDLFNLKKKLQRYEDFILNQNFYNNNDGCINVEQKMTGINGTVSNGTIRYFKRIDLIKYQMNANSIQSIDICKI
jgi:hypothetical protein